MDPQVDWTPGIGDPTFMGWFTVVAYFAAAVLCFATRRAFLDRVRQPELGRQAQVWGAAAVFLVLLGINKQLDLQTWFTAFGRAVLTKHGWMPIHRQIQFDFILLLVCTATLTLAVAAWFVRRRHQEYWLLLIGVTFTLTFIVICAASFHHVDQLLGVYVAGVKVNSALELTGIGVIALAAWLRLRFVRRAIAG